MDLQKLQNIIDGCLLGDGYIGKKKETHNAGFSYLTSCKEHCEFVHQYFKEFCTENYQEIKRREVFDSRTEKTYVQYSFRTKSLPIFTETHKRFYVDKVKIVPDDIDYSPETLLFWYIGDGELESNSGYVKLHTNSFTFREVESMCEHLKRFEAKPLKKTEDQWLVTIPRKKVSLFLETIGESPFDSYAHKWKQVPYKNKNIEKNGFTYYDDKLLLIEKEWKRLRGAVNLNQLSRKFNVPYGSVRNYFKSKGINYDPVDTKKKVVRVSKDGSRKVYDHGQQVKEDGFSPTAVSGCCNGKRKSHKGYSWLFLL